MHMSPILASNAVDCQTLRGTTRQRDLSCAAEMEVAGHSCNRAACASLIHTRVTADLQPQLHMF